MTIPSTHPILLVDDNVIFADLLSEQLAANGEFAATHVRTAQEALLRLEGDDFALILLDVGLSDMDGRDLCRILRRRGVKAPITMLTEAASEADTVLGLNAGAVDYVAKSIGFPLLAARLRAQLRQWRRSEAAQFAVGSYTFRADSRRLVASDGRREILTPKEAEILGHLCRSRGALMAPERLAAAVWGGAGAARRRRLEAHVGRLQRKLHGDAAAPVLVAEGGGYRLV